LGPEADSTLELEGLLPTGKTIFGARGEHPIGLGDAACDETMMVSEPPSSMLRAETRSLTASIKAIVVRCVRLSKKARGGLGFLVDVRWLY
jgi:hypothetical protein